MNLVTWHHLHGMGTFDNAGRFTPFSGTPAAEYIAEYGYKTPSRAWPHTWSLPLTKPKYMTWLKNNHPFEYAKYNPPETLEQLPNNSGGTFNNFIDTHCQLALGKKTLGAELWRAYQGYCHGWQLQSVSRNLFYASVGARGFEKFNCNKGVAFRNITITEEGQS